MKTTKSAHSSKKILFFLIFIGLATYVNAQFSLDAELRPRAEWRYGYKDIPDANDDPAFFISQRNRLGVKFNEDKWLLHFQVQDVKVWGDDSYVTGTGAWGSFNTGFNQAYIQYAFTDSLKIKAGRQSIAYDDQRLLCARNWNQWGLFYDAVLLSYNTGKFQFDVFASVNNNAENTFGTSNASIGAQKYKTFDFIYMKYKFNEALAFSFIGILSGYSADTLISSTPYDDPRLMQTFGGNFMFNKNGLKASMSYFRQTGKNYSDTKVNAFNYNADLSYKLGASNITIGGGISLLSGSEYNASQDNTFDILYGARYKFYGNMNQFILIDKNTKNGGLVNPFASIQKSFGKKGTFGLTFHYFMLHKEILDATLNEMDKNLGWEADMYYSAKINKFSSLKTGFSYLSPTETFNFIKGVNENQIPYWAYFMISVNPTLFKN